MDRIPQYCKQQGDVEVKHGVLKPEDEKHASPQIISGSTAREIVDSFFSR